MITNAELIETIRQANGETARQTQARIDEASARLGITPDANGDWHDDDADEICLEVVKGPDNIVVVTDSPVDSDAVRAALVAARLPFQVNESGDRFTILSREESAAAVARMRAQTEES